jgi:DnaK suppressor protein
MTQTSNDITALQLDSIRQLLEQHLQERLDRNAELAPRALPTLDPVAYQAVASNRLVIGQISAALNRLDAGTYGLCTRCGSPIAPARLEVVPYAGACIQCQTHADAA